MLPVALPSGEHYTKQDHVERPPVQADVRNRGSSEMGLRGGKCSN